MLNLDEDAFSWADIGRQNMLKPGHMLGKPQLLYQKIEDDVINLQIEKLHQAGKSKQENTKVETPKEAEPVEQKAEITYDDFMKTDLRVGTILTAEKVEKADKLLKLTVDLGFEVRTVVSGIAAFFKPEDIVGLQVCVVTNLAPRKLRGIESKGMILMAEDDAGVLHFVLPKELTKNGSIIR